MSLVLAFAGRGFAVVASDKRATFEYGLYNDQNVKAVKRDRYDRERIVAGCGSSVLCEKWFASFDQGQAPEPLYNDEGTIGILVVGPNNDTPFCQMYYYNFKAGETACNNAPMYSSIGLGTTDTWPLFYYICTMKLGHFDLGKLTKQNVLDVFEEMMAALSGCFNTISPTYDILTIGNSE